MPPKPASKGAKKAASKAKAQRTGDKKKRRRRRESYSIYIYKVLMIGMKASLTSNSRF